RENRFQNAAEFEQALARLQSAVPGIATGTVGDEPIPGRCPQCSHYHVLDANNPLARKFCESCGVPLIEPCPQCQAVNGTWSKFCGSCGLNLTDWFHAQITRLEADRETILADLAKSQLTQAITLLKSMAANNHPRLHAFVEWAQEQLRHAERDLAAAQRDQEETIRAAQWCMLASDYQGAIRLLESIPRPQQPTKTEQAAVASVGFASSLP